ncbi:hypothetical protein T45_00472 [Streptomyces turgidiscabies]|nr:hypothetical protein T45_00472 [Streptomyces turgidiscabies]
MSAMRLHVEDQSADAGAVRPVGDISDAAGARALLRLTRRGGHTGGGW